MKKSLSVLSILLLLFLGVISVVAQETEKPAAGASQEAEKSAPAPKAKAAAKSETISGTVTTVSKELLILTSSNGIPYNFKLTRGTRIKVGGQKAKADDLAAQTGKQASVEFLPLRTGNMARSIEVSQ